MGGWLTAWRGSARSLSKHLDPVSIESVLDVGGDRGQFIPLGSKRIVLDVSDRQLAPGVQRVSQVDDLNHWDLVISAHLLEHVTNPVSVVKTYANADYVYLEVPAGVPSITRRRSYLTRGALPLAYSPRTWRMITAPASGGPSPHVGKSCDSLNISTSSRWKASLRCCA